MKSILLLTDSCDHTESPAARYLASALETLFPSEITVHTADPLGLYSPPEGGDKVHIQPTRNRVKAGEELARLLSYSHPAAVFAFNSAYGIMAERLWARNHHLRPALYGVVPPATPCPESSFFLLAPDFFAAPHQLNQVGLISGGIPKEEIVVTGAPLHPGYRQMQPVRVAPDLAGGGRPHLLVYLPAHRGHFPVYRELLRQAAWDITLVTSTDPRDQAQARALAGIDPARIRVACPKPAYLPGLFLTHHLAVGDVPGSLLADLMAAGCPPIILADETLYPQWNWLTSQAMGAAVRNPRLFLPWIERALLFNGRLQQLWRKNLLAEAIPDGAERLARLIMDRLNQKLPNPNVIEMVSQPTPPPEPNTHEKRLLLCDFHTHTTWSDGKLSVRELVDFYGERRFDCLCITDHLCDPNHLLGKLVNMTGLVIPPNELDDYFAEIQAEKERAWTRYQLLLLTGIEFNRDGYRPKTSTHLLGVDLQKPIDPSLPLKELIAAIKAQNALAIASHPLKLQSHWAKNTLHLWENREEYAPLLDAWEVANRDDIFNPVGLKRLPIIANSDFHEPKHIYSWKTMLWCAKEAGAIKQCIRENRDVFLSLYRPPV